MKFYLGTHEPSWLRRTDVALFISHRRLERLRVMPRAVGRWALDSGGFTEIAMHGQWTIDPKTYAVEVRRYHQEIGGMDWASPQDWMCEPPMLVKTGLSVAEHQRRTVDNYLELRMIDADLPFVPVLQGWELDDYLRCVDLYDDAGIDLPAEWTVGVGSVCRRQATDEIETIMGALHRDGLRLHGFGVKTHGVRYAHLLTSADSMAWSHGARYKPPMAGCPHKHCGNCLTYALRWREAVVAPAVRVARRSEGAGLMDIFNQTGEGTR